MKTEIGLATLYLGDCREVLPALAPVDLIACDLPYGTTSCAWDAVIPLDTLWRQYRQAIRPGGAVILTAVQPFTSALVMSNPAMFRYEMIWKKTKPGGYLNAKKRPLTAHESILVFCDLPPPYNPQMRLATTPPDRINVRNSTDREGGIYGGAKAFENKRFPDNGLRYPTSVLEISNPNNNTEHPAQKPVALMSYLVETFSNLGEAVLDNTMGSGTTGVAAVQLGRKFIGIELDPVYFDVACKRIEEAQRQGDMFIGEAA